MAESNGSAWVLVEVEAGSLSRFRGEGPRSHGLVMHQFSRFANLQLFRASSSLLPPPSAHKHLNAPAPLHRKLLKSLTRPPIADMADGIDKREDARLEFTTSKEVTVAPTFEAMHLKENLLRGIYAYGYESPSAVQSRAIVQICKGRDTIAQAQSGTGKTATFSISILQVIDTAVRETQGAWITLEGEIWFQIAW